MSLESVTVRYDLRRVPLADRGWVKDLVCGDISVAGLQRELGVKRAREVALWAYVTATQDSVQVLDQAADAERMAGVSA